MVLNEYIIASQEAMNGVRRVVQQRDWQRLDSAVELFGSTFSSLRQYLERFGLSDAEESDIAGLRQLDIMQRKVMRQLSWHMRHTEEDMQTLSRMLN
ncbi:MAG: hypothetical protein Q9M25_01015 [Mariprofundaceae bacterium]|nr:hypothetical protein [Mariprofundaceae bacterium]